MSDHINNWIVVFVALPLATAILATLLRGRIMAQRVLGIVALTTLFCVGVGFCATLPAGTNLYLSRVGAWAPPFGIAIVVDGISGILLTTAALVALACFIDAFTSVPRRLEQGWFHPLFHLLVMGVNFSFLTGDLFNLFVAFEIMLMASYALMTLGGSADQVKQAYKYVLLNLLGSTIFVLGAGLMYGMMGTLNYADLARLVHEAHVHGRALPSGFKPVALLLLMVFGLKAALFPLWFWLPDSYWTLPPSVGAMFGALLSKVGVYAILRLYPMILVGAQPNPAVTILLPIAAGATMLVAIVGAIGTHEIRRLVCYVLISHVGYLIFGAIMLRDAASGASLNYMVQEMIVLAGLFLCCGVIERLAGTDDLQKLGGLYKRSRVVSIIVLLLLMSLSGVPPLSGFYGKAMLVREGLAGGWWLLVAATLTTGIVTLIAALRVWCHAFWMPQRAHTTAPPEGAEWGPPAPMRGSLFATGMLAVAALAFGLGAPLTVSFTTRATEGLTNPGRYVEAVLGPGSWAPDIQRVAQVPQAPTREVSP